MAIQLDCINFILQRITIEKKYPGGFEKFVYDNQNLIGSRIWYDNHLVRDGAMNPMDVFLLQQQWKEIGFVSTRRQAGKPNWKDYCIVETLTDHDEMPCSWLVIAPDRSYAYLAGTSPGVVVGWQ